MKKTQSLDFYLESSEDKKSSRFHLSNAQEKRKTFKSSKLGLSLDNDFNKTNDLNMNAYSKSVDFNDQSDDEESSHQQIEVEVHSGESSEGQEKKKNPIPKLASIDEILEYEQELAALDVLLGNIKV